MLTPSLKMPDALSAFRLLVHRCLRAVPDPGPVELDPMRGMAEPKDLPILVAALREGCAWLTTFNTRHYQPGHPAVVVMEPGALVVRIRYILSQLS